MKQYEDHHEAEHERRLVIGVGNAFRNDDGAGVVAARRVGKALPEVRVIEQSGEGASLMESWERADRVVLIDAVQSGAAPGAIHHLDVHQVRVPSHFFHYSTHAFSVAEAVEMARALDRLPPRMTIFGIEGADFGAGTTLSVDVAAALDRLVDHVVEELRTTKNEREVHHA